MSTVESKQKLFTYWRARFQVEPVEGGGQTRSGRADDHAA
jgi:hypothetical protein